jgi:hypothetical protein
MNAQEALLDDPGPCAGCRFARRCRDAKLACDAFQLFASGASKSRWRNAPRAPTAGTFAVVFGAEERMRPVRLGCG